MDDEFLKNGEGEAQLPQVLPAKHVYLLMNRDYRISRNVRAQWFFSNLNNNIEITNDDDVEVSEEDLCVLSVIPSESSSKWSDDVCHKFVYKLLPTTIVTFLAKKYKFVFCIDFSLSAARVDAKSGDVILDKMISSLYKCLKGLTAEFFVPGSRRRLQPQLYVTIIAHSSLLLYPNQQVIVQGWCLTTSNLHEFLALVQYKLNEVENCLASCTAHLSGRCNSSLYLLTENQTSYDKFLTSSIDDGKSLKSQTPLMLMVPENSFITLLRKGMLALQLLPDNTSAGIVVLTDGTINVPDIHVFQSLLSQLRISAVSCSFIQVCSSPDPSSCWGYTVFPDLMRFIATATCGMYHLSSSAPVEESGTVNRYHQGLLTWTFQWSRHVDKNLRSSLSDELHVETKKHVEKNVAISIHTLVSVRLREGYGIQDVAIIDGKRIEVSLLLPWKHDVSINYVVSSSWPLDNSLCHYKVTVRGSYEFLHDLMCPTKKPIKSVFRSSVLKKFWESLEQLQQTDELLAHLHSFSSNPVNFQIPESIRNGVPLFYLANGSAHPVLCSRQKWMHAHRVCLILAHDRPIPKHLHVANANGRFSIVQCRQALASLNTFLAAWSSFVLIENHSYIKLTTGDPDKAPASFYIIRVISQAPCIVIHLAFLGGTSSRDRNAVVNELCKKILNLTLPCRANLKASLGGSKLSLDVGGFADAAVVAENQVLRSELSSSMISCCTRLLKPVEKLLIRYERTPRDYGNPIEHFTLSPIYSVMDRVSQQKASKMFGTLGRYLYHKRWVWSAHCDSSLVFSLPTLSGILCTLTKIRIQKGFHFAHSHSGIVNMVLEVQMQCGDGGELYPCLLQYILFPPHLACTFQDSQSEEGPESDEPNGELQLVTECWVEPQCGYVTKTSAETQYLEGLDYKDLLKALFCVDFECISTLLTFELVSLVCQQASVFHSRAWQLPKKSSVDDLVEHITLPYDLNKLLGRCAQAQLIFETLSEDAKFSLNVNCEDNTANSLLMNLIQEGLRSINNCEVILSLEESLALPSFLRQNGTELYDEANDYGRCLWKCYVKGLSPTHVMLTFLPATFDDVKQLRLSELDAESQSSLVHFVLPVYTVDCSSSSLVSSLMHDMPAPSSRFDDFFQDLRPNRGFGENVYLRRSSSHSDEISNKFLSPEPRTEESEVSSSGKQPWKLHNNCTAMVYYNCYISTIFHCLQRRISISYQDIQFAMEEMCIETAIEIDITDFLQRVCLHVCSDSTDGNARKESSSTAQSGTKSTGLERPFALWLTVPGFPDWMGPCGSLDSIHATIQAKFAAIVHRSFTGVPANSDYYFYDSVPFHQSKSSVSIDAKGSEDLEPRKYKVDNDAFNVMSDGEGDSSQTSLSFDEEEEEEEESHLGQNRKPDTHFEDSALPLFIHLTCSIKDRHTHKVANCSVRTLPTCFGHVGGCSSELEWLPGERVGMSRIRVTLDVLCLTLPPEMEAVLCDRNGKRSERRASNSAVEDLCGDEVENEYECDGSKDPLGHLPTCQRRALTRCVEDIKWMLRDEIASFARDAYPITEDLLETVATHVSSSSGRPGCSASYVPLQFVFGPENSLDKFVQEFTRMPFRGGFRLVHEGKFYYVALRSLANACDDAEKESMRVASKRLVVEQLNPHQDDGLDVPLVDNPKVSSDDGNGLLRTSRACEDSENEENEGTRQKVVRSRKRSRTRGCRSVSESELGDRRRGRRVSPARTVLREEERSGDDDGSVRSDSAIVVCRNDTEDGYDGDSSDENSDGDLLGDMDTKRTQLPPFWLIMQVLTDQVDVFFQFRHCDDSSAVSQVHHKDVMTQLIENIKSICKMVNQALLLQDLHDSRMCNQLLEPEASEDIWRQEDVVPLANVNSNRHWSPWLPVERGGDHDESVNCQDSYLEATMKFMPGAFACPVMWEILFTLHPRLKTGYGRTATSRGVQALKYVLSRLSVNNRKNMFVYKERTGGAVFYLRLHELPSGVVYEAAHQGVARHSIADESASLVGSRSSSIQSLVISRTSHDPGEDLPEPRSRINSMPEKDLSQDSVSVTSRASARHVRSSEDVITLSVHGITEAGPEIKEELVTALQNKLDDVVLEVISVTLARNPMCKLSVEDVHFIQRSGSPPNVIRHLAVQVHMLPFLQVIMLYLCQNLQQFLNVPKYVDSCKENHFQRHSSSSEVAGQEAAVFLFIMPQEAGSRGVACVVLSLVDGKGNPIRHAACPRPTPDAYQVDPSDFDELTYTSPCALDGGEEPAALIQIQIWEKGKVDLEQLMSRLQVAVRYALWDVATEYCLLTAPFTEMLSSPPSMPLEGKPQHLAMSSSCFPTQTASLSDNTEDEVAMDAEVLRHQEKFELGEKGSLHKIFATVMERWLKFAKDIGVPSVDQHSLTLKSRHSVPVILQELKRLVENMMPDVTLRAFHKEAEFVPFSGSFSVRRHERKPGSSREFLLIGRNVRQWRASCGRLEDVAETFENKNYKDLQRYPPLVVCQESWVDEKCVVVPRQRLLFVVIRDCHILMYTYNWADKCASSLVEEANRLIELRNVGSCFLSSIALQKLGIFLNQPFSRRSPKVPGADSKVKCAECADLEVLMKSSVGGSRDHARHRRSTLGGHHHSVPLGDALRDAARLLAPVRSALGDPVVRHVQQFWEAWTADNRELQKQLAAMWHSRECRIGIQRLKQISRVEHYCLTPVLFDPAWRLQVASARDHTCPCFPDDTFSLAAPSYSRRQPEHPAVETRSRHSSGVSGKFADARPSRKTLDGAAGVTGGGLADDWHGTLCASFVSEFVQYLQTLGFVGYRDPRSQRSSKSHAGKLEAVSAEECASERCAPHYLQKFLLGGVVVLELVFCGVFFGVKMYALESMRLRSLSNRALNSQFVVAFLDECDKIKVCMHLHSFTYDYHLRSIHSYISGRQMALRHNYHVVGFVDDFTQYYQKSPNFARNLVHQGSVTMGPIACTPRQLFDYLLRHDRLYGMQSFRMDTCEESGEAEYVLVQISTHKVAYRDSSDTRQTDEFDVSSLISLDTLPVEFGSICLKYYIILTSCREMYPKPVAEKQPGTFRTVVATSLPSSCPPLSWPDDGEASDSSQATAGDFVHSRSSESREEVNSCELTDTTDSAASSRGRKTSVPETKNRLGSIKQEIINYLGYFSSHEELMHKIILEQAGEARQHLNVAVNKAIVDCRRDSLWERLQRNFREADDCRRKRDEGRGGITYLDFMDLLRLVSRKPLIEVDARLATFSVMPINWYQTLVKVFLGKYHDRHHHFTAADGNTQHVVVVGAAPSNWFVLLSIDLHSGSSELCVVCREPSVEWNASIHSLVEDVVNACCFHMWSAML